MAWNEKYFALDEPEQATIDEMIDQGEDLSGNALGNRPFPIVGNDVILRLMAFLELDPRLLEWLNQPGFDTLDKDRTVRLILAGKSEQSRSLRRRMGKQKASRKP